jgi:kynurenine formamidase
MTGPLLTLVFGDPLRPPRVFDLEQPRTATMPIHPFHLPGYSYVLHRRHQDTYGQDGPRSGASGMIVTMEHTGTHIDAVCHQVEHLVLCGSVPIDASTQTSRGFTLPGHVILLAQHGIYIIENLCLAELAAAEVWRFVFVCTPLKFVGATGSPVRPLALLASEPEVGQEGEHRNTRSADLAAALLEAQIAASAAALAGADMAAHPAVAPWRAA